MKIKGYALKDIVKDIVDISYQSLKTYANGEEKYLEPLKVYTDMGVTPADTVIEKYNSEWRGDLSKFVSYVALK